MAIGDTCMLSIYINNVIKIVATRKGDIFWVKLIPLAFRITISESRVILSITIIDAIRTEDGAIIDIIYGYNKIVRLKKSATLLSRSRISVRSSIICVNQASVDITNKTMKNVLIKFTVTYVLINLMK